ncbi:MAG TPA: hypothetical protein VF449_07630 [Parvibaculum sp.]
MLDSGVERRPPPKRAGPISRFVTVVAQLILPAVGLVGALGLAWSCRFTPATDFRFLSSLDPSLDPDGWLNWGVLLLPGVFFVLNLTSRRYGPSLALISAIIAWAAIGGGIYWAHSQGLIASLEAEFASPPLAVAFIAALLAGQIANIYLFDCLRGIPWWEAPLMAALAGGLVFTFIFHAATGGSWSEAAWPRLAVLAAVQLFWAIAQLVPTLMLRRVIRPVSGYGGA